MLVPLCLTFSLEKHTNSGVSVILQWRLHCQLLEILIPKAGEQVQIIKDKAAVHFREIYICQVSVMISKKSKTNMHKIISPYYLYIFLSFKLSTLKHVRKQSWMLVTWKRVHKVKEVTSDMPPGISPIPQRGSKGHGSLIRPVSHPAKLMW